ncbi:MAG: hypothetical protein II643_05175, partial [Oscillospiraceae bacterium]|nr:hypothetical protein [Oscillospiraceae bacterium]
KSNQKQNKDNQKVSAKNVAPEGKKEEKIPQKDNEKNIKKPDDAANAKETSGNNKMLSDIIKPESEDSNKKEVKFKEEPDLGTRSSVCFPSRSPSQTILIRYWSF